MRRRHGRPAWRQSPRCSPLSIRKPAPIPRAGSRRTITRSTIDAGGPSRRRSTQRVEVRRGPLRDDADAAVPLVGHEAVELRGSRPRGARSTGSRRPGRARGRSPRAALGQPGLSCGAPRLDGQRKSRTSSSSSGVTLPASRPSASAMRARNAVAAPGGSARAAASSSSSRAGSRTVPRAPRSARTRSRARSRQMSSSCATARRRSLGRDLGRNLGVAAPVGFAGGFVRLGRPPGGRTPGSRPAPEPAPPKRPARRRRRRRAAWRGRLRASGGPSRPKAVGAGPAASRSSSERASSARIVDRTGRSSRTRPRAPAGRR